MNLLNKIKLIWKKPKVVVVTGNGRRTAREAIFQVLKSHFRIGKDVWLFETDLTNPQGPEKFSFFLKKSSLPILVVTHIGDIPSERIFFAGDLKDIEGSTKLAEILPARGYLILNFDDETVRELKTKTPAHPLTLGFQERADFKASDINIGGEGTNFKINYKGNIVPVWLKNLFGKEQIYSSLAAAAVGTLFDLNLVEISQALKNYQSLPGKMRLIGGIKNSRILDDSESASLLSMIEALEILGKIETGGRRVTVLGDVLSLGKYTIEAHEAIGEKAAKNADLLFTFGARAKFIAQGAQIRGMAEEKIFQFNTVDDGKLKLQDEIREGDLILVDGSKEMEMPKIVEEIKAY